MSPIERRLVSQLQRRAAFMSPEVAAAILKAFAELKARLSEIELARAIETGTMTSLLGDQLLDQVYAPVRHRMREAIADAVRFAASDLPRKPASLSIGFDILNPKHIDAARGLASRVMVTLKGDTREVVRAFIENGLRDGRSPRAIAAELREIVGLAPNHLRAVENFRQALESGDLSKALGYKLRDKRIALAKEMTPARIDKAVAAYRRKFTAWHAETVARTATLDTLKVGQQLSQEDAVDRGILDGSRLQKTWVTVGDDRVRDEHVAMNGETVPHDSYYSNGEFVPGESTYNCRCISRFTERRAA